LYVDVVVSLYMSCQHVNTQCYQYVAKLYQRVFLTCARDVVHHCMVLSEVWVIRLRSSCQISPHTVDKK